MNRIIILGSAWRALLVVGLVYAAGCTDDATPSCAALGCPTEPSGNPELWEPCNDTTCWCGAPVAEECTP
jgi:hypothetical protein